MGVHIWSRATPRCWQQCMVHTTCPETQDSDLSMTGESVTNHSSVSSSNDQSQLSIINNGPITAEYCFRVVVNCQYSMAVFSTGERKNRPRGDRKSLEMSQHLKQTFEATIKVELYPRSQIDIYVEVLQVILISDWLTHNNNTNLCLLLQADGGNYCACVNAATLALIDAGIPLVDYVTACTASLVTDTVDTPLVDVSNMESMTGSPELTVAVHPRSGQIVLLEMSHR